MDDRITAKWVMSTDGYYHPICTNCGAHPWKGYIPSVKEATESFNYCPICGAKIIKGQFYEPFDNLIAVVGRFLCAFGHGIYWRNL